VLSAPSDGCDTKRKTVMYTVHLLAVRYWVARKVMYGLCVKLNYVSGLSRTSTSSFITTFLFWTYVLLYVFVDRFSIETDWRFAPSVSLQIIIPSNTEIRLLYWWNRENNNSVNVCYYCFQKLFVIFHTCFLNKHWNPVKACNRRFAFVLFDCGKLLMTCECGTKGAGVL
jgi:hypothetical protein